MSYDGGRDRDRDSSRGRGRDNSTRVYVGGILENVKKEDLEVEFAKYGKLTSAWVAFNPPGFAFLEFDDPKDAEAAVDSMNGVDFMGSKIRVEISAPRRGRGRGRGGSFGDRRGGGGGRGGGGFGGDRGGRGGYGGDRSRSFGGDRGGGGYRGGRGGGDRGDRGSYGSSSRQEGFRDRSRNRDDYYRSSSPPSRSYGSAGGRDGARDDYESRSRGGPNGGAGFRGGQRNDYRSS